jgi:hypothetical protein
MLVEQEAKRLEAERLATIVAADAGRFVQEEAARLAEAARLQQVRVHPSSNVLRY